VVTAKLDRAFRSAADALTVLEELKAQGVGLHMIDLGGDVTDNGTCKLVFTILSAVAEAERDRMRERISEVKPNQRRRGRYLGAKVPFGWQQGESGELIPIPEQQAAIRNTIALRDEGLSFRLISEHIAVEAGFKLFHVGVRGVLATAERRIAA
jgi:putative DNA-invertase from lambdoid prophage Rac